MKRKGGVVQVKFLKPLRHLRELVRGHRVDAAEDGRVNVMKAGKRFGRAELGRRHRIANLDFARVLHRADEVADLTRLKVIDRLLAGREDADFVNRRRNAARHESNALSRLDRAVHDAHVGDDPAKLVEDGVKDERTERRIDAARLGRRNALHDRLQHVRASHARLRRDEKRVIHRNRENILDLAAHLLHVRARQIDLV